MHDVPASIHRASELARMLQIAGDDVRSMEPGIRRPRERAHGITGGEQFAQHVAADEPAAAG